MRKVDREAIYERDGGICGFCGEHVPWELLNIDHIQPRVMGGRAVPENLRVSHQRCNVFAGAQLRQARRQADGIVREEFFPKTIPFPASLRKAAMGVAMDEDRTFASLVIWALRRYVEQAEQKD